MRYCRTLNANINFNENPNSYLSLIKSNNNLTIMAEIIHIQNYLTFYKDENDKNKILK